MNHFASVALEVLGFGCWVLEGILIPNTKYRIPILSGLDFADAELLDQFAIAIDVGGFEISLEAASLTDEDHQPAARVKVFLVSAEMVRGLQGTSLHESGLDRQR